MMQDPGLVMLAALVVGGSAFLLTLISTNAAMIFLIVSMLFSPEINLGAVQPDRSVVMRLDDFLLGVVFLTWLAKLAINKQLGVLRSTPLNVPLGLFLVSCLISTGWGIVNGSVKNPVASLFYFVKYFEYFFLFFMVANVIRDRQQVRLFLVWLLAVAAVVGLYGYWQLFSQGFGFRITAPFEGTSGEPNTLAGYLLIMVALCAGLGLHAPSVPKRLLCLGLMALLAVPFIYTYSRGGYVAFIAMYVTLCALSRRYRFLLVMGLMLGLLIVPAIVPKAVIARVMAAFDPYSAVEVGGVRLAASPAARILMWRVVVKQWQAHPFLGVGVTGIGRIVDNQHALVIGELGLLGFLLYVWVRWRLLVISYRAYTQLRDPIANGLGLGFMAGLVGLLIHSFAANIFIIVRIMEPFWFLAAIIMVLPQLGEPLAPPLPAVRLLRIPTHA